MNSTKQAPGQALGNDRLLTTEDVHRITGFTPQTCGVIMKEIGVTRHRRLFCLESQLLRYFQSESEGEA